MEKTSYKNGDFVVFSNGDLGIYQSYENGNTNIVNLHFWLSADRCYCSPSTVVDESNIVNMANKEQIDVLLNAVTEAGYEWDGEELTLVRKHNPLFKVGDKIIKKDSRGGLVHEITDIGDDYYILKRGNILPFDNQSNYTLVYKHTNHEFKPFQKVLYKHHGKWHCDFVDQYISDVLHLIHYGSVDHNNVVPYEGNEKLLEN